MQNIVVTREVIESMPMLSEAEKKAILVKPFLGIRVDFNKGVVSDSPLDLVNPETGEETYSDTYQIPISYIHPESGFAETSMTKGCLLISIKGFFPVQVTDNGRQVMAWTSPRDPEQRAFRSLAFFLKNGETVDVEYGEIRQKQENSTMGVQTREVLVRHRVQVKISYFYEVNNARLAVEIEKYRFQTLPSRIKAKLFNQDHAVEQVYKALKISMAGLKEENKPVGSYLLCGPTGTGKTELAKLLAKETGSKLVRVDMSEYSQEHQVSRFLGSPAGYVGYNDKTILETKIGEDGKKVVLLLDEMEKAHVEIQKVFLAAMDNGLVTLSNHKVVNFSNTLIIMTSNLGTVVKESLGLERTERKLTVDMNRVRNYFLPEFMGRLSGVIVFNPLTTEHAGIILDKFVEEFNTERLRGKNIVLTLSPEARTHLVEIGFNPNYGARPMKQVLQNQVYEKLADLLLFGDKAPQVVVNYSKNEGLTLTLVKPPLPQVAQAQEVNA